jgi:hypothetical protein
LPRSVITDENGAYVLSAGIGDVVDNERIVELPLQGRQVTDLIVLAGAAVQSATGGARVMNGRRAHIGRRRVAQRRLVPAGRYEPEQPSEQHESAAPVSRRAAGVPRCDERSVRAARHARLRDYEALGYWELGFGSCNLLRSLA